MPSRSGVRAIAPGYENPDTELIGVIPASPSRPETMADLERATAEALAELREAEAAVDAAHKRHHAAQVRLATAKDTELSAAVGTCIECAGDEAAPGSLYCEAHR